MVAPLATVDPLSFRLLDWRSSLGARLAYERSLETLASRVSTET